MKSIDVENDLYRYIASQTEAIGEDASAILRRLLGLPAVGEIVVDGPLKEPSHVHKTAVVKQVAKELKSITSSVAESYDFSQLLKVKGLSKHKAAVGRFLFLLEQLHNIVPAKFDQVLTISGRDRVYFAKDESTLLESNASTKPKQIGSTSFWVMTNSNTGKKRAMLVKSLTLVGCQAELATEIAQQI